MLLKTSTVIFIVEQMEAGWSSGISLFEMRKEYEEIVGISSDEEKGGGDQPGTIRVHGLPDLVRKLSILLTLSAFREWSGKSIISETIET